MRFVKQRSAIGLAIIAAAAVLGGCASNAPQDTWKPAGENAQDHGFLAVSVGARVGQNRFEQRPGFAGEAQEGSDIGVSPHQLFDRLGDPGETVGDACGKDGSECDLPPLAKLVCLGDGGDRHVLDKKVRRHQRQPADAMVLAAARVDGRDRGAIGMPDQQPPAEVDPIQHPRQDILRLIVHVGQRPRQRHRARRAIASA